MYHPPPLYAVTHMDRPLRGRARDVSPAQAALTIASRHGMAGDYRVVETAGRRRYWTFHITRREGEWGGWMAREWKSQDWAR